MNPITLPGNVRLTATASVHMRQCGIKSEHLAYCLAHGKQLTRNGLIVHVLRRQDIRPEHREWMDRVAGLVAIREAGTSKIVAVHRPAHQTQQTAPHSGHYQRKGVA